MNTPKARWTILIYIAAHNDLQRAGQRSLNQILDVGSSSQLKLAILYDRPDGAIRYIAGKPGQAVVEEPLGRFDSGDPDALLETACWAFEQLPAERYALVLWSHGSGWRPEGRERSATQGFSTWTPEEIAKIARQVRGDDAISVGESRERAARPGNMAIFRSTLAQILERDLAIERAICFDDGSGHTLDTLELERVVREVKAIIGQPLDLLGMDACVMATLEIAYQMRCHVQYLVASEELVPSYSWPYDTILATLRSMPETSARNLAALVVQHYVNYYTANPPPLNSGDVTKVALELSRIEDLVRAVDGLAKVLLEDIAKQTKHLWDAQRKTQHKETKQGQRRWSKFDYHLWDLGTLAAHLAAHSDNASVQSAAGAVRAALQPVGIVLAEGHRGEWFDGIGGISIYAVPPGLQRISPYYADMALAKKTRWGKMLSAYHQRLL